VKMKATSLRRRNIFIFEERESSCLVHLNRSPFSFEADDSTSLLSSNLIVESLDAFDDDSDQRPPSGHPLCSSTGKVMVKASAVYLRVRPSHVCHGCM
jgi:hypothetical protein